MFCGSFLLIKKIKVGPVSHFNLTRDKLAWKVFNLLNFEEFYAKTVSENKFLCLLCVERGVLSG